MTPAQLASLTEEDRAAIAFQLDRLEAARRVFDPVEFAKSCLGITPWSKQSEILRAVATHERVAVRSGHKVGKSTSAAILALWWVQRWPDGRVVMTAPTGRQVRLVLWRELVRLHRKSKIPLGGWLSVNPDPGLKYDDGREVVGFSTDEPEKIAGVSGAHVLYIVDEGSGVSDDIFEAIEGSRAGGAKLVVLGNPTRTSGTFYGAFTASRASWFPLHVSSEHSPNLTGEVSIPGLATAAWVKEKAEEWGEESPLFQVRVRGNFPSQAENAVIGISLAEAALARYEDTQEDGRLEIGVDVARFGDDESVIWPRRGNKALEPVVLKGKDTVYVAGEALRLARRLRYPETTNAPAERAVIKVDGGGVGGGVVDLLKQARDVETVEVNAGEASTGDTYARLRDQLWFSLKDWLKNGGAIPEDDKLYSELIAPVYGFDLRGRIKVESKDDTKEKLNGRSPDRADALALAVFNRPMFGTSSKYDSPMTIEEAPSADEQAMKRRIEEIERGY